MVHRHSEITTQASEERYRVIVENANDMITSHDAKGRVVFASLAAQHMLGEPVQRILGDGLFERVHVADRPAYLSAFSRCLTDDDSITVEFRVRRASPGESVRYAWVEMRCRPMPSIDAGLERTGIVAVTRDITGQKTQETQLRKARNEAESASRAKTQFLASMSHELRTPFNAVIGFSEIFSQELFGALGEARYRDYARLIHESGEHLLNVVNDILDISKIEAGKFKITKAPFDVAKLVESCCDVMRYMAEQKSIDVQIDVAVGLPELAADKRACKQMLLNVISNAIKFTEAGGWVKVRARRQEGSIVFAVFDNGIGIAAQDLPRLGEPFVQANDSYERDNAGTGLGLSVVRGLARLHGGTLEFASTLGKGTTAIITLPLNAQTQAAPVEPSFNTPRISAA